MDFLDQEKLESIGKYLKKRKQTIAVAESVTGGMLQFALSTITDASTFYQGGLTAYNLDQKLRHLHIEPVHAKAVNCVSLQVAREMALAAWLEFSADWALAITGYASPVPESDHRMFAYYAISKKGKIVASGKISFKKGDPAAIQIGYVNRLITKLVALMK